MFLIFFLCVQNMIQIFIEHIGTFENLKIWLDPERDPDVSQNSVSSLFSH